MTPRPPLPNTVRIVPLFTGPNGVKAANVVYSLMAAGWTPSVPNLTAVANNYISAFTSAPTYPLWPNFSSAWTLTSVTVYDNGGTTEDVQIQPAGNPGGSSGNPVPPSVASTISWQIPAHYRGGHPRMYIPGTPEGNVSTTGGNWWSNTWRATLAHAAQAFITQFAAGVAGGAAEQLGTIAFKRNNVPLATPVFYPYSGGEIHQRLDSQRRRLGKENVDA